MNRFAFIFYSLFILINIQCKQRESQSKSNVSASKESATSLALKTPADKAQAMANAASKLLDACKAGNVSDTTKQICSSIDTFTDENKIETLFKDSQFKSALQDAENLVASSTSTDTATVVTNTNVALALDDSSMPFLIAGVALISVGAIATVAGLAGWREFSQVTKQTELNANAVKIINETRETMLLSDDKLLEKYGFSTEPKEVFEEITKKKFEVLEKVHPLVKAKVINAINNKIKIEQHLKISEQISFLTSFNQDISTSKIINSKSIPDKGLRQALEELDSEALRTSKKNGSNIMSYTTNLVNYKWQDIRFNIPPNEVKVPKTNFQKFSSLGNGNFPKLTAAAGIIGLLGGMAFTVVGGLHLNENNNGNAGSNNANDNSNKDNEALLEFVNTMSQIARSF